MLVMTRETRQDFDGNASHRDGATTYVYDSLNGNLLEKKEWGEVMAYFGGSFSDIGEDVRVTLYHYATDGAKRFMPSALVVRDGEGVNVKEVKYLYDDLSVTFPPTYR